jgi:hypothetical protein
MKDSGLMFLGNVSCQSPPELRGRDVTSLSSHDFDCEVLESCPEKCHCVKWVYDENTIVNCSQRGLDELPSNLPVNTTILLVDRNRISSLKSMNTSIWKNVKEIYAEENMISHEEFYVPQNLKIFYVNGNRLAKFPDSLQKHIQLTKDFRIKLSNNPWPCDCSVLSFRSFLIKYAKQILDASDVQCNLITNSSVIIDLIQMDEHDFCPNGTTESVGATETPGVIEFFSGTSQTTPALIAVSSLLMIGIILTICYKKYEQLVKVFIYTYCSPLHVLLCCRQRAREQKTYDCFISYGFEDRDVTTGILDVFDQRPNPEFSFCFHERTWKGGASISDNIFRSVEESRMTLIVISKTFVRNKWFHLEFQAALMQMLKDKRDRIIFVILRHSRFLSSQRKI